jgi:hypothetical protein
MTTIRTEIDGNFDAFQRQLRASLAIHPGEFALLRHGEIVDFFGDPGAALIAGNARFADRLFSIQEVSEEPVDLGVWSHA